MGASTIGQGLSNKKLAVVGGGILGMYAALQLRKQGADVTLFEAASKTGGLTETQKLGHYRWDRFYHVVLLSDLNTRSLLSELGIENRLTWGVTKTGFYTDGALYSMSNSVEFLRFPPISLWDKVRLGFTIFTASRIRRWRRLEQILAIDWLRKWSGRRVVERIWKPLLRSKLGENYHIASAAFIWATIARMYAARRSGLKKEMFGYIDGGYELVLSCLQERLNEIGVETIFDARVDNIDSDSKRATVHWKGSQSQQFDSVILTLPTSLISNICSNLTESEKKRLNSVTYQGIICASFLTRKPLSRYYVTNITDEAPFTAVIEMTALVDRERFGGNSLIYLPCYLTQDSPLWEESNDILADRFLDALESMYSHFNRDQVIDLNMSRARHVLALSTLNYSEKAMPRIETSLGNVFVLNSAQIAAGTLNVNETLGVVNDMMDTLVSFVRTDGLPA